MKKCERGYRRVNGRCVKRNSNRRYIKRNNPLNNKIIYLIIGILFLIFIWYGGKQGWFKFTFTVSPTVLDPIIINQLQRPTQIPGETCSISMDRSVVIQGESVRGTINDGVNKQCTIYVKFDPTPESINAAVNWIVDSIVTTGPDGRYQESRVPEKVGIYTLVAICGNCVTSSKTITVKKPVAPPPTENCVDSDGEDRYTFGNVQLIGEPIMYDDCLDSDTVIELVCVGDLAASKLLDCPTTHKCEGGKCVVKTVYNVGDEIGSQNEGGNIHGGEGSERFLNPSDYGVEVGGPYILGIKIEKEWHYVYPENSNMCEQHVAYTQTVDWTFADSTGVKWYRNELYPSNTFGSPDLVCPVYWDGMNRWYFEVLNTKIPSEECAVIYNYKLTIYVCGLA